MNGVDVRFPFLRRRRQTFVFSTVKPCFWGFSQGEPINLGAGAWGSYGGLEPFPVLDDFVGFHGIDYNGKEAGSVAMHETHVEVEVLDGSIGVESLQSSPLGSHTGPPVRALRNLGRLPCCLRPRGCRPAAVQDYMAQLSRGRPRLDERYSSKIRTTRIKRDGSLIRPTSSAGPEAPVRDAMGTSLEGILGMIRMERRRDQDALIAEFVDKPAAEQRLIVETWKARPQRHALRCLVGVGISKLLYLLSRQWACVQSGP